MTDYSKISDAEIAQKVFFWLSNDFFPNSGLAHINKDGFFFFDNRHLKRKFDPCNNPSDAWPIIVDNGISLECIVVNRHEKTWRAQFKPAYVKHHANDKNPLRAAMIVFLMMQEKKE